jgi:hypothetical protein
MQQVYPAIARRAYELFEKRGYEHGHDWKDWFQAESQLHLNECNRELRQQCIDATRKQ